MAIRRIEIYQRVAKDLIERLGKGEGVDVGAFAGEVVDLEVQKALGVLQKALVEHYGAQKRPVRISKATAMTLLGESEESLYAKRAELGYDPKIHDYDFDKVRQHIGSRPRVAVGSYVHGLTLKGELVVVSLLKAYTGDFMAFSNALAAGATLQLLSIEQALLMRWKDPAEKALLRDAYMRVLTQLSEEAQRPD